MALEGDGPRLREALRGESSEDEDAEMNAKLRTAALATDTQRFAVRFVTSRFYTTCPPK